MMRVYYILSVVVGSFLLSSCFDEEAIHAELEHGRVYDTTSSDPVMKYISKYYFKYDKEIIFDADTADYVFNFKEKNDLKLVNMDKDRWGEGLEWLKTNFLDYYSAETIQKSFPRSLIVVDSIYFADRLPYKVRDLYITRNMIAFAVDKNKKNLTGDAKKKLIMSYHTNFISFCTTFDRINIDQFYTLSANKYGGRESGKHLTPEEGYALGFLKVYLGQSWWTGEKYTDFPSRGDDYDMFLNFLLTGPEEELESLMNTYTVIKTKFEILINAFESGGIDYKKLRNI